VSDDSNEAPSAIERRRFLKAATVTAWAVPFVLTMTPNANATISPAPCGMQGDLCIPSAPTGSPDSCCAGLTCFQTIGGGDPAPVTFTCQ
jgi:hypothetical protein